jgi:hypothetical protein
LFNFTATKTNFLPITSKLTVYVFINYLAKDGISGTGNISSIRSMLDETNFYHQRQGQPSELTKRITYILGDYTQKYPLSLATLGALRIW